MGGGGGGQQIAPSTFLPPNQAGAAQNFQNLTDPLVSQSLSGLSALGGISPAQLAYPGIQTSANNIYANPYAGQVTTGYNEAVDIFNNQYGPLANATSQQAGQFAPQALNLAFNPQYGQAQSFGNTNAGSLQGAGNQILGQAFDPQSALYNRTLGQVTDQANAQLSDTGLLGTPYGGSTAGKTISDFNIDWQNSQLAREEGGAQSAGSAFGTGLNQMLTPANNAATAASLGTSAFSNLSNTGLNALGNEVSQVGPVTAGPYYATNVAPQTNLKTAADFINLGNQNYALPNQTISDMATYLGLGTTADQVASQAASVNNTIGQTNFGQIGSGIGGASNLLFGSNSGGLLGAGGLLGGGGAAPFIDASGGAGLETLTSTAADAGGGGSFLGSLLPFAGS